MKRLSSEDGFALVPALAVLIIVLLLGAAVLATVNAQSNQSGAEREQEGAFQVAESALNSQLLQLSRTWPTDVASAYPACNQSTASSATCTGTALASNYTSTSSGTGPNGGSDFAASPTWSTRVIDDVDGPDYYTDSLATRTPAPCACDANGDGKVWVRSQATVAGRNSVVVSLVEQSAPRVESLPSATIIAGWFNTTNEGKKTIVSAQSDPGSPVGTVAVRCASGPAKGDPCLGYDPDKGQLTPASAYQTGYVDGTGVPNATNRTILDADALARLKATAISLGTYYPAGTCPPTLTGAMIYVENADCTYTANGQYNSPSSPGVVIFASGTLTISATTHFYGLIYMANGQGSAPASGPCTPSYQNSVVNLGGNTTIHGAIMVDKCGGVNAGASGVNIIFDSNVFAAVKSNGTAAGVKNSFRIIPAP